MNQDYQQVDNLIDQLKSISVAKRHLARRILAELNSEPAIERLLDRMGSPVRQFRWEIVSALSTFTNTAALPGLIKAMHDEDEDIRLVAARGLSMHGHEGLTALARAIEQGHHANCFYQAARYSLRLMRPQCTKQDAYFIDQMLDAVKGPAPGISAPVAAYEYLHV